MPASPKQKTAITNIFKRLNDALDEAVKPKELTPVAEYTIDLIVKRTRLGYGVDRQFGNKQKLKGLSAPYIARRKKFKNLFVLTRPGTSNLTLTGQMLTSMGIVSAINGKIFIGPTGSRTDSSKSNATIAAYQEEQGRIFNRVSALEYQQVLRFYRRSFGDLLKRKRLLQ